MVEVLTRYDVTRDPPPGEKRRREDQQEKMRRQDFLWNQEDHEKAMILTRAHGCSLSELLRRLVREEFRRPRLRISTPLEDVMEIIRRLCKIHKV